MPSPKRSLARALQLVPKQANQSEIPYKRQCGQRARHLALLEGLACGASSFDVTLSS